MSRIRYGGLSRSQGNAAYLAVAGAPTGNATSAIQALLDTARTNGGGYVRGLPGQTYDAAGLVIGSNTTVDFTGCTVELPASTTGQILTNYAFANATTVMDGAMTAASAALACATSTPFASWPVGTPVLVWGAGMQDAPLRTTIASKTDSGHVTLAAAAVTTISSATVCIGTRDKNIEIIGGTWQRNGNTGGSPGVADVIRLRRIDGLRVKNTYFPDGSGFHDICLGDVIDFKIDNPSMNATTGQTDLVHLHGPLDNGKVRGGGGVGTSAMVSMCPNDYVGSNDVWGKITNVEVDGVHGAPGNAALLAGVIGGITGADHITIKNLTGETTSAQGAYFIGDDSASANTQGGRLDNITVENVRTRVSSASAAKGWVSGANIGKVTVDGTDLGSGGSTNAQVVGIVGTVDTVAIKNTRTGTFGGNPVLAYVGAATVKQIIVDGVQGDSLSYLVGVESASATVDRIICTNYQLSGRSAPVQTVAGATTPYIELSNGQSGPAATGWMLGSFANAVEIHATNLTGSATQSGIVNFATAAGAVTLYAANCNFAGLAPQGTAGGTLRSKTHGVQIDVSNTFVAKNAGDLAYNTSASVAAGVGLVQTDGTTWYRTGGDPLPVGGQKSVDAFASPTVVGAGTFAVVQSTSWFYAGGRNCTSAANGDNYSYDVWLPKGTFTLEVKTLKNTDSAIMEVLVDTVSQGTVDCYAASAAAAVISYTVTTTTEASHRVTFKATGKNASSSAFNIRNSGFTFTRTA